MEFISEEEVHGYYSYEQLKQLQKIWLEILTEAYNHNHIFLAQEKNFDFTEIDTLPENPLSGVLNDDKISLMIMA